VKTQPILQPTFSVRGIVELAAVAALYVACAKIGFLVAIPPGNVTTVFPAAGVALAAILLLGMRVWPGVWFGSFIVNIWVLWSLTKSFPPISIGVSGSIATGSTLQALAATYLIHRFIGPLNRFARPNDTFRFVGIELLTCLIAPSIGVTSLCASGFSHWSAMTATWPTWFLGDFTGALIVAPLILSWFTKTQFRWTTGRIVETIFSSLLVLATCLFIFFGVQTPERFPFYPRSYMFVPLMVWAAFRFGQKGVTLLAFLVSAVAVWATVHGSGPFLQGNLDNSLITLHLYLVILTFTGLVLASAVMERLQTTDRFRLIFDSAPGAMIMVDRTGRINLVNSQSEKLFGYKREELLGQPIEILVPQRYRSDHHGYRSGFSAAPETRPMGERSKLFAVRKDGSEFPVEIGLNAIETPEGMMILSAIVDITERNRAASQIQTALEEKEILLQEIHHRVKNNLQIISSLLSIQARRIEDPKAKRSFIDSQSRIESIALIHEILCHSKDLGRIDFARYVRELSPHLLASYSRNGRHPQMEVDVEDIWLGVDRAVPLGLLLTEVVSNSLIHAFPSGRTGKVRIELRPDADDLIVLTVTDNGVGFAPTQESGSSHSIGLQLVNKLAEQIHGTLAFQSSQGTEFKMTFHK
jgi:PAS domain S-box-containing protein